MDILRLLPHELTRHVVFEMSHDFQTLLALRLTNKTLYVHATPLVFRRVNVYLEGRSLQKLVNIARASHLRCHVKHISCGMKAFYDIDFDKFKRRIYERDFDDDYDLIEAPGQRLAYDYYTTYFKQQGYTDTRGRYVSMMTCALALLPALNLMDISNLIFRCTAVADPSLSSEKRHYPTTY